MRLSYELLLILTTVCLLFYMNWTTTPSQKVEVKRWTQTEDYNVWVIFTRVRGGSGLKSKFQKMLSSMVLNTGSVLSLNLVVDSSSRFVAKDIVDETRNSTGKYFNVVYHEVHVLTNKIESLIKTMKAYFSSKPGAYYSSSLFFISLGLHRLVLQKRVVMLDVDTVLKTDVVSLFDEFENFSNTSVIGAASELTPVYHHVLYIYRSKNNGTSIGTPELPGINSGVLLLDLEKMRSSKLYQSVLTDSEVERMTSKYFFKGHLGDQDFYTLLSFEHPTLIHRLNCGWNRQLCLWWKYHGYNDSFNSYFSCHYPVKIYHGNCNTKIPD